MKRFEEMENKKKTTYQHNAFALNDFNSCDILCHYHYEDWYGLCPVISQFCKAIAIIFLNNVLADGELYTYNFPDFLLSNTDVLRYQIGQWEVHLIWIRGIQRTWAEKKKLIISTSIAADLMYKLTLSTHCTNAWLSIKAFSLFALIQLNSAISILLSLPNFGFIFRYHMLCPSSMLIKW